VTGRKIKGDPFREALWEHTEHLPLRGLVQTHIDARRSALERLEALLGTRR